MDFLKKNNFPGKGSGIRLERNEEDGSFSLYIKDNYGKVIGCGLYDSSIQKDELKMGDSADILTKIGKTLEFLEFKKESCFFFLLSDNHYYLLDIESISPTQIKSITIEPMVDKINEVIGIQREIGTRKEEEKVEELLLETEQLKVTITEKEECIKGLEEKILQLEYRSQLLEECKNKKDIIENKLKFEYVRNTTTLIKLGENYTKEQIKRLIQSPFDFEETKFFTNEFGVERNLNKIVEMSINLNYPLPILKIRVEYDHWRYKSGGDGYPSMHYPSNGIYYYLISEDGEIKKDLEEQNKEETYALIERNG